jgi:hypothetical protein
MIDAILERFLEEQFATVSEFASSSDLMELSAVHGRPPSRYLAHFFCKGLVLTSDGQIAECDHFEVGIHLHAQYLRKVIVPLTITILEPLNVWHPNINGPLICVGHLLPGTELVSLLYQVYEIITFHNVTMKESDALNAAACKWARQNQSMFPLDRRPLKRRRLEVVTTENTDHADE